MDRQQYRNDSYGQISFSRTQCTGKKLYGSEIKHDSFISMEINNSEMVEDDLHQTHYFERDKIIEVSITASQFAELITTLNYGTGVPCTLEYVRDVGKLNYIPPYDTNVDEKLEKTINIEKERFKETVISIQNELKNILSKKNIGKKDKEELQSKIDMLIRNCINNYKFAERQFKKQMEKHIVECKTEIESTLSQISQTLNVNDLQKTRQIKE